MQVKGRLIGQWGQGGWLFRMLSFRLRKDIESTLYECANIYLNEIYNTIATGGYGMWPPLTPDWQKRKGGGGGFYEYKGEFLSQLKMDFTERGPVNYAVAIGVDRQASYKDRGIVLGQLLGMLEDVYGRPLFDLAWDRVEATINRKLEKIGGQVF